MFGSLYKKVTAIRGEILRLLGLSMSLPKRLRPSLDATSKRNRDLPLKISSIRLLLHQRSNRYRWRQQQSAASGPISTSGQVNLDTGTHTTSDFIGTRKYQGNQVDAK